MKSILCNPRMGQERVKRNVLHIYTGDGKGKTSAAIGVMVRALGHGMRVSVIQFMKGQEDSGEWKLYRKVFLNNPNVVWRRFGRQELVDINHPTPDDFRFVEEGLQFARQRARISDIVICDELNVAIAWKLVSSGEVYDFLDDALPYAHIILTGRGMPDMLRQRADLVTIMKNAKHPFDEQLPLVRGLDY